MKWRRDDKGRREGWKRECEREREGVKGYDIYRMKG